MMVRGRLFVALALPLAAVLWVSGAPVSAQTDRPAPTVSVPDTKPVPTIPGLPPAVGEKPAPFTAATREEMIRIAPPTPDQPIPGIVKVGQPGDYERGRPPVGPAPKVVLEEPTGRFTQIPQRPNTRSVEGDRVARPPWLFGGRSRMDGGLVVREGDALKDGDVDRWLPPQRTTVRVTAASAAPAAVADDPVGRSDVCRNKKSAVDAATWKLAGCVSAADATAALVAPGRESVEVVSERTASSKTFSNEDGTRTVRAYPYPIHEKSGTGWVDVDPSWVVSGTKITARGAGFTSELAPKADKTSMVAVNSPAGRIGYGVEGVSSGSAVTVEVNRAVYKDVLAGVDFTADQLMGALKTSFVINRAGTVSSFRLPLTVPPGVTVAATAAGSLEFRSEKGAVVFVMPFPDTWDANGVHADKAVRLTVDTTGAAPVAVVTVDPGWLGDKARVFPVVVDPTITVGGIDGGATPGGINGAYTPVISTSLTGSTGGGIPTVEVGELTAGGVTAPVYPGLKRALVYYDLLSPALQNAQFPTWTIQSAVWRPNVSGWYGQVSPVPTVAIEPITSTWDAGTVTWANQPTADPSRAVRQLVTGTAWSNNFDITDMVQRWSAYRNGLPGGLPYFGFLVKALGPDGVEGHAHLSLYGAGDPQNSSVLEITYSPAGRPVPAQPSSIAKSGTAYSADYLVDQNVRRVRAVGTLTPALTSSVSPTSGVAYFQRVGTQPDALNAVWESGWDIANASVTVPAGYLRDGVTYFWQTYTCLQVGGVCPSGWVTSAVKKFRTNAGLGSQPGAPADGLGPVSVNLANGNGIVTAGTRSVSTAAGGAGFSFTFNSQAPVRNGLWGRYFEDVDGQHSFPPGVNPPITAKKPRMARVDPALSMSWGVGAPSASVGTDRFMVEWTGYITFPSPVSAQLGLDSDDGSRLWLGPPGANPVTLDTSPTIASLSNWGIHAAVGPVWSTNFQPAMFQTYPIKIQMFEDIGQASIRLVWRQYPGVPGGESNVPASWLTPGVDTLPAGWTMSSGSNGRAAASVLNAGGSISVTQADGSAEGYESDETGQSYVAADPEVNGQFTVSSDGQIAERERGFGGIETMITGGDGGVILLEGGQESKGKVSYQPKYGGVPARLWYQRDPLSGRRVELQYGGDLNTSTTEDGRPQFSCAPGSGAPLGMLCRIRYIDGKTTELSYDSSGRVSTIYTYGTGPIATGSPTGDEMWYFGWSGALPTTVITPWASDLCSTLGAQSCPSIGITYNSSRVTGITGPYDRNTAQDPSTSQTTRSYSYAAGGSSVSWPCGARASSGAYCSAYAAFDGDGRTTAVTDATGKTSSMTWDPLLDIVTSTTDPAGRKSVTYYDDNLKPVESWGPGLQSCFSGLTVVGCQASMPHSTTQYDATFSGLLAQFYENQSQSGGPKVYGLFPPLGYGDASFNWGGGQPSGINTPDNWSGQFTGDIILPAVGEYQLRTVQDDGVRIFIDNKLVLDFYNTNYNSISPLSSTFTATRAGERKRIRIDYVEGIGNAALAVQWRTPSSGGAYANIPVGNFTSSLGLVTRTDSFDGTAGSPTATATVDYGNEPWLGLPIRSSVDPAGLNLTTMYSYANIFVGGPYKATEKKLPGANVAGGSAANKWVYSYYANVNDLNPCSGQQVTMTGLPKSKTRPNGVVIEYFYDSAGRVSGTREGGYLACAYFDARDRLMQVQYRNAAGITARTVSTYYNLSNNPTYMIVGDTDNLAPGGAITRNLTQVTDFYGRPVYYADAYGASVPGVADRSVSRTYDRAGNTSYVSGAVWGLQSSLFDAAGRLTFQGSVANGVSWSSTPHYNTAGEPDYITYRNATTDIVTMSIGRDAQGRTSYLGYSTPGSGAGLASDEVSYSQSGRVVNQKTDGVDANPLANNFVYDGAGRLTNAFPYAGQEWRYQFGAPPSGCPGGNPGAGANSQYTGIQLVGSVVGQYYYCVNSGDQLGVFGPGTTYNAAHSTTSYDSRGNMATVGGRTLNYDASNRWNGASYSNGDTEQYFFDGADRTIGRLRGPQGAPGFRYNYGDSSDRPYWTSTEANTVLERMFALPGGASAVVKTGNVVNWAFPSIHGDTLLVTDNSGVKQGSTQRYTPEGRPVDPPPALFSGTLQPAYLGTFNRYADTSESALPISRMGARPYLPTLQRFAQPDPVEGGAGPSDYAYPADPINGNDVSGLFDCRGLWRGSLCAAGRGAETVGRGVVKVATVSAGVVIDVSAAVARFAGRCVSNPIGCLDDIKTALAPLVLLGMTVTVAAGLVAACATVIGCFVAVPLLGTATVGGAFATVVVSWEVWFSPDRCKVYEVICAHKEAEDAVTEALTPKPTPDAMRAR